MAAIGLDGLTKHYGDVRAADDLTFDVESGEIFGYLGPNGAGKTTTIRLLLGLLRPTSGTATVLGNDIRDRHALREARRRIGYLPADPAFDDQATGTEVLDLHAAVKGDTRRAALLEQFEPPLDRPVRDYSSGNVQQLGIVTAFMHDPDLVILDEPTRGLDPLVKHQFASFLRDERDRGVTVFFSSHILSEVRRLCDRVGILRDGRLVRVDPIDELLTLSGKVVRLDSTEPVSRDVVDIDGVHDLETSLAEDQLGDPADAFTHCTFTYTGDITVLLDRLAGDDFVDVSIEEAPLEDVFLRFYGGQTDA